MRVLLGTTNPSKVKRFSDLLKGYGIEFITLRDIEVIEEPEEMGNTPEENAIMKAEFYGQYFDVVICNDSGLYFEELDFEDLRQPGLNIRTPMNRDRLSDEEMIDYYSKLITGLPYCDYKQFLLSDHSGAGNADPCNFSGMSFK